MWQRQHGQLYCEGISLADLAEHVGTPTYVYSEAIIASAIRAYQAAFAARPTRFLYSVKANSSLGILALMHAHGIGADIVSGGELARWLAAGGRASDVVFSGVGKTRAEMHAALSAGILAFNVESPAELAALADVARELGRRAPVQLRVNPDVDAGTHPYISTGLRSNKFGIRTETARELLRTYESHAHIEIVGLDFHIGSQLGKTEPFADAIALVLDLLNDARTRHPIRSLDIGGGLGIDYQKPGEALPPSIASYGAAVLHALRDLPHEVTLYCEPGRSIMGPAGALLSRVLYTKANEAKHFTIVDAAMNDLLRPALYGAYHPIWLVNEATPDAAAQLTEIVGPVCESSDWLAKDRELPLLAPGALVAIGQAGAYGASMSSNYNTRPRPAEVLVSGNTFRVIRQRESVADLFRHETP